MSSIFDVIIVGARCAGATLAIYLARAGCKVLLLDKSKLPSDQVLSTHTIHPPGIDILDEVGVGKAMREVTPPTTIMRLRKNEALLDIRYLDNRAEYCPRRVRLDQLLQEAAVDAGAELRDQTRVIELVAEHKRISGVRVKCRSGKEEVYRAGLVVGADGRHSTVARLVNAEEYLGYDAPRAMYWAYWDMPDFWHSDTEFPFGMYVGNDGGEIRVIFQTDHDQLLIGSLPPVDQAKSWQADPKAFLKENLSRDPYTGPLTAEREPVSQVRGTIKERYFFRRASGPGWVLVGDAGHHKEFVIGDGMTEALIQARSLATAVKEDSDHALERWWRARDLEALPYFFFGQEEGLPGSPTNLQTTVFSKVKEHPELLHRMALMMEHQISPYEVFPPSKIFRWTLAAFLKGKFHVMSEFLRMGRRISGIQKELRYREKLFLEAGGMM